MASRLRLHGAAAVAGEARAVRPALGAVCHLDSVSILFYQRQHSLILVGSASRARRIERHPPTVERRLLVLHNFRHGVIASMTALVLHSSDRESLRILAR